MQFSLCSWASKSKIWENNKTVIHIFFIIFEFNVGLSSVFLIELYLLTVANVQKKYKKRQKNGIIANIMLKNI